MEGRISDSKIYELALNCKNHAEDRRDEINKYYPSLFTVIIAIFPLLNKLNETTNINTLILLSIGGIVISISWLLTLKRTVNYLEAVDKLLIELEQRNNQSFISYINNYLEQHNSPRRVTKQTMAGPYIFMAIFASPLIYILLQSQA
jgi:hypothetical protein